MPPAADRAAAYCAHCTLCGDTLRLLNSASRRCMCGRTSGALETIGTPRIHGPGVLLALDLAALKRAAVDKRGAGMWWIVAKERPA